MAGSCVTAFSMSTSFKPLGTIALVCNEYDLSLVRLDATDPPEYQLFRRDVAASEEGALFQGTEERVSDFLTGWMIGREELLQDAEECDPQTAH